MGGRAHVAVLDPLPIFRLGVVEALTSDEIVVESPTDIRAWATQGGRRVVVLTLLSEEDWVLLDQLGATVVVIAVLEENTAALSVKAIRLGAGSVIPRSATATMMRRAVDAVLAGEAIVSRAVIRSLISASRFHEGNEPRILEEEIIWLRHLASGMTIARLASTAGYSERAMYRLLNGIYDRLGVANRTEALIRANAYGWLDVEST